MGYDDGAEVQQCAAQGLTVYRPTPQTSATTKLGLCSTECWTYTAAQDGSVCPAGGPLTDRVGTEAKGRKLRSNATAACGRCALKAHGTRNHENRHMLRWDAEDVLERMQQRLANHAAMLRQRKAMVEHPIGTIKRWMDPGDFLRRGKQQVRTAMRLSLRADHRKRVLHILGVKAMIAALA
jgi:hypothetical protein